MARGAGKVRGNGRAPPLPRNTDDTTRSDSTLNGTNGATNSQGLNSTINGTANPTEDLTPNGTANPTRSDSSTNEPVSPTPATLRQQLTHAIYSPKKSRKRKRVALRNGEEGDENEQEEGMLQRKLDRLIRWNCFLYFTNNLWESVAKDCYGDEYDIDSDAGQGTRLKIFDCVKNYKNKVLNNMEVCV